ncbi:hypothetical protein PC112_g16387 [Phytophthora cactorum]|nr:hypothetical protein PC112_g16387 [Phytophthora cactorum]
MSEAGGLSTLDEEVTDTSLPTTSANRCVRLRSSSRYRSIKASIPSKLKKLEDGWLDWKDDLVSSAKYWRVQRVHSTTMLAAGLNGTRPSYYKRMHHQLLPAA